MARELSYVIINPYSLSKSRTGAILSRLLTRTSLELVGASMFAPSYELVHEYAKMIVTENDPQDRQIQQLIREYILENYTPDPVTKLRRRVMVLLFAGSDAVARTREAVGNISRMSSGGETVRDTFADLVFARDGSVRYFEPAVLAAPTVEEAKAKLQLWSRYAATDAGLVSSALPTLEDPRHQRTLVILKPDTIRFPGGRPGNVIDLFSKTGLAITAIKVHRMSVAEAEEFYGPVRAVLREKLVGSTGDKVKELLESALGITVDPELKEQLGRLLGPKSADHQFDLIVQFMTGYAPKDCSEAERRLPGKEKCLILVYEGIDAVQRIRQVLGPTDPAKAPPGSIRREFGQNIMVNAAHASDSVESAQREMDILRPGESNFSSLVSEFYGS
ncbi:Nucleoside diphosphate kinase [Methylacidimicrobium cyclopophantes]|uniref:Nucleoside diphosphate kinase n=1 Tax=Methylacidimicrobium cyclopophantes TaxID=1041766 RepID=A0A5E6MFF8_9BACT|nr:nucleoside-diphosphate kinase [Methylacidimicrobium cyclopophantes]VVM07970.1 Nucleoside diphosphate kinase [Methylacidimicrobium cyclopophantes]